MEDVDNLNVLPQQLRVIGKHFREGLSWQFSQRFVHPGSDPLSGC
jgi:hypothetical protein